jgi:hypothetical protein
VIALPLDVPAVKATERAPLEVAIEFIVGAPGTCATKTLVMVGGVNVLEEVFVAASAMVPPFNSIGDVATIPSVSMSFASVATVYLNKRAEVPLPDT